MLTDENPDCKALAKILHSSNRHLEVKAGVHEHNSQTKFFKKVTDQALTSDNWVSYSGARQRRGFNSSHENFNIALLIRMRFVVSASECN